MDRNDAVIFRDLLCEGEDLVLFGVAVRLIHEAEGAAERPALHGLADVGELPLDLLGGKGRRIIARHARADRALPDQGDEVHIQSALRARLEIREAAGVERVEQTAADLVPIGRVRFHAEGGKAAVAGDLGGDALLQEGLIILLRILTVIEKVIVRVGVDESGADLIPAQIHDLVGLLRDLAADLQDAVVLDQNVPDSGRSARAVIDRTVFEQRFHCLSSLSSP